VVFAVGVCFGRMLGAVGRVMLVSSGRVGLARRGCETGSRRASELPVGENVQWIGIGMRCKTLMSIPAPARRA